MIAQTDNGFQRPTCVSGGNTTDQGVLPRPRMVVASAVGTGTRSFWIVVTACGGGVAARIHSIMRLGSWLVPSTGMTRGR